MLVNPYKDDKKYQTFLHYNMDFLGYDSLNEEYFNKILQNDTKFKVVFIDEPVRVQKNGRWYWGLTVFDFESEDFYWVEYNHCVSLEGFAVLERLLDMQFPWMGQVGGLRQQTIEQAKALLAAAEDEPYYVEHFDND